jgi:hypothetical protein
LKNSSTSTQSVSSASIFPPKFCVANKSAQSWAPITIESTTHCPNKICARCTKTTQISRFNEDQIVRERWNLKIKSPEFFVEITIVDRLSDRQAACGNSTVIALIRRVSPARHPPRTADNLNRILRWRIAAALQ